MKTPDKHYEDAAFTRGWNKGHEDRRKWNIYQAGMNSGLASKAERDAYHKGYEAGWDCADQNQNKPKGGMDRICVF